MPDKKRPTLTDAELRIMRALWTAPESTVSDVVEAIGSPRLARNTVMTMLGILERKGYAEHRTDGRTFVYRARVAETDVQRNAIDYVLSRFFGGSPEELVVRLVDSKRMSKKDRERVRALLSPGDGKP